MPLRPVLQFPDPLLRRRSLPLPQGPLAPALRQLARDMIEIMYDEPGIGLAAPQVGEAIRLVVMDTDWDSDNPASRNPGVLVNPEIISRRGQITWTEGCLSVPDFQADVERAEHVQVRYADMEGEIHSEEVSGLRAVCFQHELDHLDGILFIDRISKLRRDGYVRRRRKALKFAAPATAGRPGAAL